MMDAAYLFRRKNFDSQDYLEEWFEQDIFLQDFDYKGYPSSPVKFRP